MDGIFLTSKGREDTACIDAMLSLLARTWMIHDTIYEIKIDMKCKMVSLYMLCASHALFVTLLYFLTRYQLLLRHVRF
jgi:hypothetical protein